MPLQFSKVAFFYFELLIRPHKQKIRQFRRQHIREHLMSPGTLHMNGIPIEETIIDYSAGRCQVQTNAPLTFDQMIQITVKERDIQNKKAQVRWIQKKGRKIYAGFKFTS
nr:PilZ domain-containing protein [Bacillus mycoides]